MMRFIPIVWLVVFAVTFSACSKPKPQVTQAMVDDFVVSYQAAYEAGDREPLMLLIHWPHVPPEIQYFTKAAVFPFNGQRELRSIEAKAAVEGVVPEQEHEGKTLVPNLTPTHRLEIIFEPEHRGGIPERYEVWIGVHEGELRLCGWLPRE